VRVTDADDIDAVAARVVALLLEHTGAPGRYVDAAALARILDVDREWVYSRARRLGAVRLGDGPKARLRFDIEHVRATLAGASPGTQPEPDEAQGRRRGRPRRPAGRGQGATHPGEVRSVTIGHGLSTIAACQRVACCVSSREAVRPGCLNSRAARATPGPVDRGKRGAW
jgi:hypothetical protein